MAKYPQERKHTRITVNERLQFLTGEFRGQGRVTNVSLGGVGAQLVKPPLTVGSRARVSFMVGGRQVEAEAVVKHSQEGRAGLQFIELAPHERFGLEEFIRYHTGQSTRKDPG